MRPDIPPDFLAIIDAVRVDQQVNVILKLRPALIGVGNVGAREFVENLTAVRTQAGFHSKPERRVRRKSEQVRQEKACTVHELNGGLTGLDSNVDVETEDQVGAGNHLQILHDGAVAFIRIDLLLAPEGEWMGAAG